MFYSVIGSIGSLNRERPIASRFAAGDGISVPAAGALCMRSWKLHSRFYATVRSDEARRDSLAAEVTGPLEIGGDPLAFG